MYLSQLKNIIKNETTTDKNPNVTEYLYKGNDLNYLYNVKVEEICLTFYKKKLYMISIRFGSSVKEYLDSEFNLVQYSLEKVFGDQTFKPTNESGQIVNGFIWKGKKVTLEHFKLDFSKGYNDKFNHLLGYVDLYENNMQKQRLNDEF